MNIQGIFNRVIDGGFYRPQTVLGVCSMYMCHALVHARNAGTITYDELAYAFGAIDNYLGKVVTLRSAMVRVGIEATFEKRLAVYSDWDNRPSLGGPVVNAVAISGYDGGL